MLVQGPCGSPSPAEPARLERVPLGGAWTYLLPDGRLFIAGPHVPTQRFDWTTPADFESFATNAGDRSSGGEKGSSVMAILRPPDYRPIVYIMGGDLPGPARAILGGGDPGGPAGPTPHERFFPEYFDLLRPTITNAPASINYGGTFQVDTPTPPDIAEVVILRAGAVTHGYDQSQRGLELVIIGAGAGTIDVESPPNPNLAPPGW